MRIAACYKIPRISFKVAVMCLIIAEQHTFLVELPENSANILSSIHTGRSPKNDLGILNSTVKTHINHKTHGLSLLDLSIVHPALYLDFECEVLHDPHGSDHYPIIVTFNGSLFEHDKRPRWNFKKADWNSFRPNLLKHIISALD